MQELYLDEKIIDLGFVDSDFVLLKEAIKENGEIILAKMHNHPNGLKSLLSGHQVKLVYSHRDLRACILSLTKKTGKPFDKVYKMSFFEEAVLSLSNWQSYDHITYIDYKDIKGESEKAVKQIASFLQIKNINTKLITEKFSIERQKKRIKSYKRSPKFILRILLHKLRLAPLPKDENSLLHFNHIQSGSIEEWKNIFTKEQSEIVKNTYSEWMNFFKYE
ncbi:hypothetical protein GCM10007940_34760 [Portibacter lacus]|uniref:Sulfotransferase domain-containing protein n=2 Tax=Portibacter lacus TaxID=1099794 RepID=A0AA37SW56_9BACT|nr:hypothetical protein GCM10007940_34760 [Portibacter lacus]